MKGTAGKTDMPTFRWAPDANPVFGFPFEGVNVARALVICVTSYSLIFSLYRFSMVCYIVYDDWLYFLFSRSGHVLGV